MQGKPTHLGSDVTEAREGHPAKASECTEGQQAVPKDHRGKQRPEQWDWEAYVDRILHAETIKSSKGMRMTIQATPWSDVKEAEKYIDGSIPSIKMLRMLRILRVTRIITAVEG